MTDDGHARGNLGTPTLRFIGRESELERLRELLATDRLRLLLVTGPAGVGKSRIALEAARSWLAAELQADEETGARAFAIDLGSARELEPALRRIGAALGLSFDVGEAAAAAADRIGNALSHTSPTLLVLDDADSASEALRAVVDRWLETEAELRVAYTSRRELPAGLPYARLELAPLAADDALALFLERARRVRPELTLGPPQESALHELIERVDALPLAIELLAPRLRLLSPQQLLSRFEAVEGPGGPLAQALARSWELLSPAEREVLAQSSTFRDGFYLEAAEAVISLEGVAGPSDLLTLLEGLCAQSLLRTRSAPEFPDEVRIQHFTSVQEFARTRLGDPAAVDRRHRAHYLAHAERWDAGIESEAELECTRRLMLELPNLEAAFERTGDDEVAAARLGLLLHFAYQRRGPFGRQAELCERVLAAARGSGRRDLEARGLLARARVARWNGGLSQALGDLAAARELAAAAGDLATEAGCLRNEAACHFALGAIDAAAASIEGALRAADASGRDSDRINAENGLGYLWTARGDFARAERALERALGLARRARIPGLLALVSSSLAELTSREQRFAEAERHCGETIAAYEALHYRRQLCSELLLRGRVRALGARPGAREDAERALSTATELGLVEAQRRAYALLGQIAFFETDFASARVLFERADDYGERSAPGIITDYVAAASAALGHRPGARDEPPSVARPTPAAELLRAFARANGQLAREAFVELARRALSGPDAEARRIASVLLECVFAPDSPVEATPPVRLEWNPAARRFRVSPHAAVDLTRRRALWSVLGCLVARHELRPGETVALSDVLEAGWPGERMAGDSGARRVYVTVNRLRKAGLGELILTTGEGYMLAPHVEVVRGGD